jgi:predicted SAM-dependent methyltransferase
MRSSIKKLLKPALKPLWVRLWPRLEARIRNEIRGEISGSLQELTHRFLELNHKVHIANEQQIKIGRISASIPAIAKISSENTTNIEELKISCGKLFNDIQDINNNKQNFIELLTALERSQRNLEGRVEFVRREILYEMKYADATDGSLLFDQNATGKSAENSEIKIVNEEKLNDFVKNGIRLNLGCGLHPLADYLNVDMRELPEVDIVAPVDRLPFEKGSIDEITCSHLVEHFPQEFLTRKLMPYWHSLLKDGGVFHAIMPDCDAMVKHAAAGDYSFEDFREVLFGAQDYAGDFHYNALTPASFTQLLKNAGFEHIQLLASGRVNGKCYEFEIMANKAK